jgi:HK97 gp10 family phage protein
MSVQLETSQLQRWGGLLAIEVTAIVNRVKPAVGEQTDVVVSRAQASAPALTGALRGSIRPTGAGRSGLSRRVRAGNSKAFYAGYQEFGTRKMDANPFLLEQVNSNALSEYEGRVGRALDDGEIYQ